jgi:hypothetical protein
LLEHAGHGHTIETGADLLKALGWWKERPAPVQPEGDEGVEAAPKLRVPDPAPTDERKEKDPWELNVISLVDLVNAEDDVELLEEIFKQEEEHRHRPSALSAIRGRIDALGKGSDGDGA